MNIYLKLDAKETKQRISRVLRHGLNPCDYIH